MIVGLLLAAGGAKRFGSQKLVATLDGLPLVRHAAATLLGSTDEVHVVIGSRANDVRSALDGLRIAIVDNPDWELGLSTSLRRGVESLPANAEAVVVALGDQPRMDAEVLRQVIAKWRATGQAIVTARYRGVRGHPVLFARSVFRELLATTGDAGARALIERVTERVAYADVDDAVPHDVDSPADLAALDQPDSQRTVAGGNLDPHQSN